MEYLQKVWSEKILRADFISSKIINNKKFHKNQPLQLKTITFKLCLLRLVKYSDEGDELSLYYSSKYAPLVGVYDWAFMLITRAFFIKNSEIALSFLDLADSYNLPLTMLVESKIVRAQIMLRRNEPDLAQEIINTLPKKVSDEVQYHLTMIRSDISIMRGDIDKGRTILYNYMQSSKFVSIPHLMKLELGLKILQCQPSPSKINDIKTFVIEQIDLLIDEINEMEISLKTLYAFKNETATSRELEAYKKYVENSILRLYISIYEQKEKKCFTNKQYAQSFRINVKLSNLRKRIGLSGIHPAQLISIACMALQNSEQFTDYDKQLLIKEISRWETQNNTHMRKDIMERFNHLFDSKDTPQTQTIKKKTKKIPSNKSLLQKYLESNHIVYTKVSLAFMRKMIKMACPDVKTDTHDPINIIKNMFLPKEMIKQDCKIDDDSIRSISLEQQSDIILGLLEIITDHGSIVEKDVDINLCLAYMRMCVMKKTVLKTKTLSSIIFKMIHASMDKYYSIERSILILILILRFRLITTEIESDSDDGAKIIDSLKLHMIDVASNPDARFFYFLWSGCVECMLRNDKSAEICWERNMEMLLPHTEFYVILRLLIDFLTGNSDESSRNYFHGIIRMEMVQNHHLQYLISDVKQIPLNLNKKKITRISIHSTLHSILNTISTELKV